jgi:Protein of unknown function (DUF3551)
MGKIVLRGVALGAVAAVGIAPDGARAQDYPFCIKGDGYPSALGDCSFDTYQQCLATASGRSAYCDANPFYAYPAPRIARPRKPYRAH